MSWRSLIAPAYPQEYLCLAHDACDGRWRIELENGADITHQFLFLGYRPLVIAVPRTIIGEAERTSLLLRSPFTTERASLARIALKRWWIPALGEDMAFFIGVGSSSRLQSRDERILDLLRQWRNARKSNNIRSHAGEFEMTRIAYAWPREIHLATVGPPEACNIFPTDLHGGAGDGCLNSLRIGGKALKQVQEQKRFALFRMPLARYKEVYALAPRHVSDTTSAALITSVRRTWQGHAVPESALSGRVLLVEAFADQGIHRIMRSSIIAQELFAAGSALAHVHRMPLTWLKEQGRAPDVLLR
jgi:hypothetical protein